MSSEIYENKNKEVENLIAAYEKNEKNKSNEGENFISWPGYTSNISSNVKDEEIKLNINILINLIISLSQIKR